MARLRGSSFSRRSPSLATSAVVGTNSTGEEREVNEEETDPVTRIEDLPFPLPGEDYNLEDPSPPARTPSYTGVVGRAAIARRARSQSTASLEADNPPRQREFRPRVLANGQHASPPGPLSSPSTVASSSPGLRPSSIRPSTSPQQRPVHTSPARPASSARSVLPTRNTRNQGHRRDNPNRPNLYNRPAVVQRRLRHRAERRNSGLRSRTVSTSPPSVGPGHPWIGRNFPSPGSQLQGELDRSLAWDEELRRRMGAIDEVEEGDDNIEEHYSDQEDFDGDETQRQGTPAADDRNYPADLDEYSDATPPRQQPQPTPPANLPADNLDEESLPDYVDEDEDDIRYRDRILPFGPDPMALYDSRMPRMEDFLSSDEEEEDEFESNEDVVTYTGVSPRYTSRRPDLPASPSPTPTASSSSSSSSPSAPSDPSPSMINPNRSSVPALRPQSRSRSPAVRPRSRSRSASAGTGSAHSPSQGQRGNALQTGGAPEEPNTPDYFEEIFGPLLRRENGGDGGSSDESDDSDDSSRDENQGEYGDEDRSDGSESRSQSSDGEEDEFEEGEIDEGESDDEESDDEDSDEETHPDDLSTQRHPFRYPQAPLSYDSPSSRRSQPRPSPRQRATSPGPAGNRPRTASQGTALPLPTFAAAANQAVGPTVPNGPPLPRTPSPNRRNNATNNPDRISPSSAVRHQYEEELRLLREELNEAEDLRDADVVDFQEERDNYIYVAEELQEALNECNEHRRQLEEAERARAAAEAAPAPADPDCPERLRRALEDVEESREEVDRLNGEVDRITAQRDEDLNRFMTTVDSQEDRIEEVQALLAMAEHEDDDDDDGSDSDSDSDSDSGSDPGSDSTEHRTPKRQPTASPARRAAAANARELTDALAENDGLIADNAMLQADNDRLVAEAAANATLIEELQDSDEGILRTELEDARRETAALQERLRNETLSRRILEDVNRDLLENQQLRDDIDADEQLQNELDSDAAGTDHSSPSGPPSSPSGASPRTINRTLGAAQADLANARALLNEVLDDREEFRLHAQNQAIWLGRIGSWNPIRPEERMHDALEEGQPPRGHDYSDLLRQEVFEASQEIGGNAALAALWETFDNMHQDRHFRDALVAGNITLDQYDALNALLRSKRYEAGDDDEDDSEEEEEDVMDDSDEDQEDSERADGDDDQDDEDDDDDGDDDHRNVRQPNPLHRAIRPNQGMSPRFIRRNPRRTSSEEDDQRQSLSPHVRFARGTSFSPEAEEIFLTDEEEELSQEEEEEEEEGEEEEEDDGVPAEEPGDGDATPTGWEIDEDLLISPNTFPESEPSPSPYVPARNARPVPGEPLRRSARRPRLSQRALESQETTRNLQRRRRRREEEEEDEEEEEEEEEAGEVEEEEEEEEEEEPSPPPPKRRRTTQATRGRGNAPARPTPVPTSSSPASGPNPSNTPSRLPRNALIPVIDRNEVDLTLTAPGPRRSTRSTAGGKRKRGGK